MANTQRDLSLVGLPKATDAEKGWRAPSPHQVLHPSTIRSFSAYCLGICGAFPACTLPATENTRVRLT